MLHTCALTPTCSGKRNGIRRRTKVNFHDASIVAAAVGEKLCLRPKQWETAHSITFTITNTYLTHFRTNCEDQVWKIENGFGLFWVGKPKNSKHYTSSP